MILLMIAFLSFSTTTVWAAGEWVDYCQGKSFTCRSEFRVGPDALPKMLTQLRTDIGNTLGFETSDELLELYLFRNRRSFVQYVSQRVPEGASRQALYVKGEDRARVYIYRHRKINDDIRHECTHAIIHQSLPYLPLWMDEGLAEYFEVERQLRSKKNPHLTQTRFSLLLRKRPELARLERINSLTEMHKSDYRNSWAWMHFMLHESQESRQLLLDYLQQIREGEPPGPFSTYLYTAMPNANARLVRHLKTWK